VIALSSKIKRSLHPEYLLSGTIPAPLNGVAAPRFHMTVDQWKYLKRKLRMENVAQYGAYCCECCGNLVSHEPGDWLEVHEIVDVDWNNGVAKFRDYACICTKCHQAIHIGRTYHMWKSGKYSNDYLNNILHHFSRVCVENDLQLSAYHKSLFEMSGHMGLFENVPFTEPVACDKVPWDEWKFRWAGKIYGPCRTFREHVMLTRTDGWTDELGW